MGEMRSYESNSRKLQFFRFSYVASHTLPHVLMHLYVSGQNNVHACLYWPCPLSSTLDSILSLHLPLPDPSPAPSASQTPSKITNVPVQLIGCYVGRVSKHTKNPLNKEALSFVNVTPFLTLEKVTEFY